MTEKVKVITPGSNTCKGIKPIQTGNPVDGRSDMIKNPITHACEYDLSGEAIL